jgi:hypothetical protein
MAWLSRDDRELTLPTYGIKSHWMAKFANVTNSIVLRFPSGWHNMQEAIDLFHNLVLIYSYTYLIVVLINVLICFY